MVINQVYDYKLFINTVLFKYIQNTKVIRVVLRSKSRTLLILFYLV